jgi:hypothetical protein
MKKFLFIILTVLSTKAIAANEELLRYRMMMRNAYKYKSAAVDFINATRTINFNSPPILIGFKAISELMMCNHVSNPLNKLSYFNKGKSLLEKAIEKEPLNAELRFMRFCTQVNTPTILGYSNNILIDKTFLIEYLIAQKRLSQKEDEALFQNVRSFLCASKICSEQDKNSIKNL